jgi:hypothetical protein
VEKYLYGLQLSYAYGKSYCNHDVMIKSGTNNFLERENHVNESINKFNDPPYMPQFSKSHYCVLHTFLCVRMCFKVLKMFIGMITPWDPAFYCNISNKEEGGSSKIQAVTWSSCHLKQVKPSYMAIKKALCVRKPELF